MTTKSDFFNENNGRYYLCKDESRIVCNLKQSWSLAKMQEAVDAWRAEINFRLAYEKWEIKFRKYAIAVGYSHSDDICFTSVVGIGLFKKYKDDLAGALDELRDRYGLYEEAHGSLIAPPIHCGVEKRLGSFNCREY